MKRSSGTETHRKTPTTTRAAIAISVCLIMVGTTQLVEAQGRGVRAGVSGDPDQFYVGVHGEVGPVVESVLFRPNLELGIGDDRTLIGANIEFAYRMPLSNSPWRLYAGGGPALNIVRRRGDTDAGGGLNVMVGVDHTDGFFTELKVGVIDSPSVKFGVGYTFRP